MLNPAAEGWGAAAGRTLLLLAVESCRFIFLVIVQDKCENVSNKNIIEMCVFVSAAPDTVCWRFGREPRQVSNEQLI